MNIELTPSQRKATSAALEMIAYYTAREAKGKRQQDAIAHCKRIGVDHTAPTFAAATAQNR